MKKQGLLTLATVTVVALFVGTVLPAFAQDQGQGQGQGQGRGQGRRGGGQGGGGFGRGGFGGQFGRGGFGMMGGPMGDPTTSSKLMLIQRDDVRSELGISAKQREQMDQEQQKAMQEMQNNRPDFSQFQNLSPEERRAKMDEFRQQMQTQMKTMTTKMETSVEGVLTPAQKQRLGELDLQWRGPLAVGDEKVASKLKLTPDQQRQVSNILTEYRNGQQEVTRNAFGGFGRGPGGPGGGQPGAGPGGQQGGGGQPGAGPGGQGRPNFDPQEMRTRMETMQKEVEKLRKAAGDKVVALLTAEQKGTWKTLQGKAFTFRTAEQGPPRTL